MEGKDDTGERAGATMVGRGTCRPPGEITIAASSERQATPREDVRVIDRSRRRRRTNPLMYATRANEREKIYVDRDRGNASPWRVAITYDVARSVPRPSSCLIPWLAPSLYARPGPINTEISRYATRRAPRGTGETRTVARGFAAGRNAMKTRPMVENSILGLENLVQETVVSENHAFLRKQILLSSDFRKERPDNLIDLEVPR